MRIRRVGDDLGPNAIGFKQRPGDPGAGFVLKALQLHNAVRQCALSLLRPFRLTKCASAAGSTPTLDQDDGHVPHVGQPDT